MTTQEANGRVPTSKYESILMEDEIRMRMKRNTSREAERGRERERRGREPAGVLHPTCTLDCNRKVAMWQACAASVYLPWEFARRNNVPMHISMFPYDYINVDAPYLNCKLKCAHKNACAANPLQ
jgi:hypothetical protein